MDDGIKTLGLHLCATCRERSSAHFDNIYFRPSYYYVYKQSHLYKIIYYTPIEVKVGLLSENVLAGCIVTKDKCSRITQHLEFHIARRRPSLNHITSGVETIKACT